MESRRAKVTFFASASRRCELRFDISGLSVGAGIRNLFAHKLQKIFTGRR